MPYNTYFDNASTSFPKSSAVGEAMHFFLQSQGGTYGRAAYLRVFESSARVENTRELLAQKMGLTQGNTLFFCQNASMAINTILRGFAWKKKKVLVSPLEHNAVMRVLAWLRSQIGLEWVVMPHYADGSIDMLTLKENILASDFDMMLVNHQSNVNGVIQDLKTIGSWAHSEKLPFFVDASQSFGSTELNVVEAQVDYLAFTGHKALGGPMGTGGFYAKNPHTIQPLIYGGTGSRSNEFEMPECYPDRFEAGTPNVVGLLGLEAALLNPVPTQYLPKDFWNLIQTLEEIEGLHLYKALDKRNQGALFSFTSQQLSTSAIADKLYTNFGIECRASLHCAPLAHQCLGTYPQGSVRIALSPFHQVDDLHYLAHAIKEVLCF
ncbi:MAG: aminotransferase class V-fold PLP-dependent enzyme [Bacteroidales bacterium]